MPPNHYFMKLTNCLDETLCGLLMMKLTASENHEQIRIIIKGSLFGNETNIEHQFRGKASLSSENMLENSKGIIDISIKLDELDITHGKVLFSVTENEKGKVSANFARWNVECEEDDD